METPGRQPAVWLFVAKCPGGAHVVAERTGIFVGVGALRAALIKKTIQVT